MNNVRRTLVKSYGILFPVVEASGVKHFRSPAAGKNQTKGVYSSSMTEGASVHLSFF